MTEKIAKKYMHINEKRRHCFRQYFGPVHMNPLLFKNEDFLLLFDLVCFVLFSPVWPIDGNSVSGDNSYRECILLTCFPKWRLLNTFASCLRVDGRKREVFEYHDVIKHMPRVAIVFPSFLNCEDGRKPGGVRTTIAMHCGFKIFKMAAKVEKFRRLYALFFNRYSPFLRSLFSIS